MAQYTSDVGRIIEFSAAEMDQMDRFGRFMNLVSGGDEFDEYDAWTVTADPAVWKRIPFELGFDVDARSRSMTIGAQAVLAYFIYGKRAATGLVTPSSTSSRTSSGRGRGDR